MCEQRFQTVQGLQQNFIIRKQAPDWRVDFMCQADAQAAERRHLMQFGVRLK
jgi:hypothetical protein